MDYENILKSAYKKLKGCANCGKIPEIRLVNYFENPSGDAFIIKCQCGMQTIPDTIENNLKRWNKRK